MMKWPEVDLQLFDGAAAGAAGAPAAGEAAPQAGPSTAPGSSRRGKTGGQETVLYGKQDAAMPGDQGSSDAGSKEITEKEPEVKTTSSTLEERRKQFNDLVRGEFRDIYELETQNLVHRRVKDYNDLKGRLDAQSPVLEMLMERYGVADGDLGKLRNALESDDRFWADKAEEAGLSVEQYRQFQQMQRENARFKEIMQQQAKRENAERTYSQWVQQGEELKQQYPEFDLRAECQNEHFMKLLRSGVPVRSAYEVLHMDEIKGKLVNQVAQSTEKTVVEGIRAKGARPPENGIAAHGGVQVKSDPGQLNAKDRARIAELAKRGEKIKF